VRGCWGKNCEIMQLKEGEDLSIVKEGERRGMQVY